MPQTKAKPATRRKPPSQNGSGSAKARKSAVAKAAPPAPSLALAVRKPARLALRKAAPLAARLVKRTAGAALDRARASGEDLIRGGRRLPIQRSIDVAVPLDVAWDEWTGFGFLPDIQRVRDVERDGDDRLVGQTTKGDWAADVVDERQDESFAWRTVEGSDCAGLATFHRLSDRLTRIELHLDVVPTGPVEALALVTRAADRRAGADLRRFKAAVEALDPDEYEEVQPEE